jgi:hypothetical protein
VQLKVLSQHLETAHAGNSSVLTEPTSQMGIQYSAHCGRLGRLGVAVQGLLWPSYVHNCDTHARVVTGGGPS